MKRGDEQPLEQGLSVEAAGDVATVARGAGVQITGQIAQSGFAFVFTAVAIHLLGTSLFGAYRKVVQVLAIAGQLGLAGFNYAAMRFITRARASGDHGGVKGATRVALWGTGIASACVVVALIVFGGPLASLFSGRASAIAESQLAFLFRLGAAYVPLFAFLQTLRYCTQAYKTMVPSVIAGNIIQPATRFVLGVGILVALVSFCACPREDAVTGAVTTLIASMGAGTVAAAFYLRRMLTPEESRARPKTETSRMVRFALPQAGASLLGVQSLGLGILVLGIWSRDYEVGLFGVALALQGPGGLFLSGIVNIWAPVVSDLYERGETQRLASLFQTITRWVATFSFPVFAALIIQPDLFVRIFAGSSRLAAAPVVAILAAGNLFYTGTGPTGYVISMTGRPLVNFVNSVLAIALYVGLGARVVPEHGAIGMAVVDAAVTALINTARVVEAWILVGMQPFGRSFLKPLAATLAGAGALLVWTQVTSDETLVEIVGLAIAGLVYLVVLRVLGIDAEERYVWERIKKRVPRPRSRAET